MLFGIYTASDTAEYIAAGSTVEEIVEQLEEWSDDRPINMQYLQIYDGIPVRLVQHTVYKVVPI
jgi:hypothetical protein